SCRPEGAVARRRFNPRRRAWRVTRLLLPKMGLRARITIAFAVGALLMSAVLAVATLGLTRQNLLDQRESSATARTYQNARTAEAMLPQQPAQATAPTFAPTDLLASIPTPTGSRPVLVLDGRGWARNPEFSYESLPEALRDKVLGGEAALMRFDHEGSTFLAVGVPLSGFDGAYFEVVSLAELESTLESIGISLLAAAILTTLAGAAVGWWAAAGLGGRLLRGRLAGRGGGHARVERHLAAGRRDPDAAGRRGRGVGGGPARPAPAAEHRRGGPRPGHRAPGAPRRVERRR